MGRRLSTLLIVTLLCAGGILSAWPHFASAQTPEGLIAVITWPADGQQLFGPANIIGSAAHPTAFSYFTLEYNDLSDPNAPWMLVQPSVQQQVQDNVLGTWNTNMVPDGNYRLRLRVFLADGQVGEFIVANLAVVNSEPTPVPTAPAETGGEPALAPTFGPSPTSPVVQPPSSNPSISGLSTPEAITGSGSELSEVPSKKTTRVNLSRVRSAFCAGVYLTFGIFVIMLGYALLRGRLRPLTQRLMWQSQDEWTDQDDNQ
jgi:hypothetical protein